MLCNDLILHHCSKPTDADSTDGGGGIESGLPGVPGLDSDNYITVSNVNWRQGLSYRLSINNNERCRGLEINCIILVNFNK